MDPAADLRRFLLAQIPDLEPWFEDAEAEGLFDLDSEYSILSRVVRPYLESLVDSGGHDRLAVAWSALEEIETAWPGQAANELGVMMEELDLWRFHQFMGAAARKAWLERLTWYPTRRSATDTMNMHVDAERYKARWLEEIDRIGGLGCLTQDEEYRIAEALVAEFQIETLAH